MSAAQANAKEKKRIGTGPIYWICRGVFIEAIRRRELMIVALFVGLFVIGAFTARFVGAETDAAAAFIVSLGVSVVWTLTIILAILLGARQFPDELESRSLYPLLAKPVARYQYVIGKWLATMMACAATALVLNAIVLAASPWPDGLHFGALLQAVALEVIALGMVAALAIFFSIWMPKSMAIVVTGLVAFAAMPVITILQSKLAGVVGFNLARWVTGYIPALGRLDLFHVFSAGAPAVDTSDFLARIAYGAIVTLFALALATTLFEKRAL